MYALFDKFTLTASRPIASNFDAYGNVADYFYSSLPYYDLLIYADCPCPSYFNFDYEVLKSDFIVTFDRLSIINDVYLSLFQPTAIPSDNLDFFIHRFDIVLNVEYISNNYLRSLSGCSFSGGFLPIRAYLSFSRFVVVDNNIEIFLGISLDFPLRYDSCNGKFFIDDVVKFIIPNGSAPLDFNFILEKL